VCLPHPDKFELNKISFPSKNKKYQITLPNDRQTSVARADTKTIDRRAFQLLGGQKASL
jgi:hypothetical protein